MNDKQENPYYDPGNIPEIDTAFGVTSKPASYFTRGKSVEARLNALGNDSGYERENGYAIRANLRNIPVLPKRKCASYVISTD